jgi:hypothetical protein
MPRAALAGWASPDVGGRSGHSVTQMRQIAYQTVHAEEISHRERTRFLSALPLLSSHHVRSFPNGGAVHPCGVTIGRAR